MYSNNLVCDIIDFIDININICISIDDIAEYFSYNRFYIMKLFKREVGISIIEYINRLRIYNSLNQLKDKNKSCLFIALNNGFNSLEYYSETFSKIIGVSPSIYRNFLKRRIDDSYYDINSNLIDLYSCIENVREYKKNRRPDKLPTLKKSFFR